MTGGHRFDRDAVRAHVSTLHELAKAAKVDGVLVLACYGENPATGRKTANIVERFAIGDVDAMADSIMTREGEPHLNIYAPWAIYRHGLVGNQRGGHNDIVCTLALVVDQDSDTGKAGALPLPAPLVIESSRGNFQAVYPLARPLPPEEAQPLAVALQAATGSDHGTKDLDHVWRVAGTLNWPNKKKAERGRPLTPQPVRAATPWAGDLIDSDDLRAALASYKLQEKQRTQASDGADWRLRYITLGQSTRKLIEAPPLPNENRSETAASVISQLTRQGWSDDQIAAVIRAHSSGIGARYIDANDLEADIARMRGKFERRKQAVAEVFRAMDVKAMQFEPIKYVVLGYIADGLTLFCGKPKVGKSWLLLHAAIAVSTGGFTLGDIHCIQGDVLYCALEDSKRRLQSRMRKLMPGFGPWPERLSFTCEMPRLNEGGIEFVDKWLDSVESPRAVIIDTLAMVRAPRQRDQSPYAADYDALVGLRELANKRGIAIVVVHHLRKAEADDHVDAISGTLGLAGCPDTVMLLKRDSAGTMLVAQGRDIESTEKAITFDKQTCTWRVVGDAADVRRSEERAAIVEAFRDAAGALEAKHVVEATGMRPANVRKLLGKLVMDGTLKKAGYGKYVLEESGHTGHTGGHTSKNAF